METILFFIVITIAGGATFYFLCVHNQNTETETNNKSDNTGCYVSLFWGLLCAIIGLIIGCLKLFINIYENISVN